MRNRESEQPKHPLRARDPSLQRADAPLHASWAELTALLWKHSEESSGETRRRDVRMQSQRAVLVVGA